VTSDAARGAIGGGGGRHPPAAPAVDQGFEPPAGREPEMPFPLDEIELVRWPGDGARRRAAAERGTPRLLLVAGDAPPPRLDPDEDWLRVPADERDLLARMQRLAAQFDRRRCPPRLDVDRALRYGGRTVVVSRSEAAVLRPLLARFGELVTWDGLRHHLWPNGDRTFRSMSARIFRLRARLEPIGLTIYTIRGRGVVLDHDDRPTHHTGAAAPTEMPTHTSEETTWLRS
jgi:DNA-binding winged helix-turn-helix (wHTH) protein